MEETSKNQENKGRKNQREISRRLGCGQTDDDGGGQWMEKNSDGVGGWGEEKKLQLVRKEGGEDLDRRGVKCEGKWPQREMEGFTV